MDEKNKKSVIPRAPTTKVERAALIKERIRDINESTDAVRMGGRPHSVKSMYRDVYEFYQNNEC